MKSFNKQKRCQALEDQDADAWESARPEVFAHVANRPSCFCRRTTRVRQVQQGLSVRLWTEDEAAAEGKEY